MINIMVLSIVAFASAESDRKHPWVCAEIRRHHDFLNCYTLQQVLLENTHWHRNDFWPLVLHLHIDLLWQIVSRNNKGCTFLLSPHAPWCWPHSIFFSFIHFSLSTLLVVPNPFYTCPFPPRFYSFCVYLNFPPLLCLYPNFMLKYLLLRYTTL